MAHVGNFLANIKSFKYEVVASLQKISLLSAYPYFEKLKLLGSEKRACRSLGKKNFEHEEFKEK